MPRSWTDYDVRGDDVLDSLDSDDVDNQLESERFWHELIHAPAGFAASDGGHDGGSAWSTAGLDEEETPMSELCGLFGNFALGSPSQPNVETSRFLFDEHTTSSDMHVFEQRIATPPWICEEDSTAVDASEAVAARTAPTADDLLTQSHAIGASLFLPWWEEKSEDHFLIRTSMRSRAGEGLLVDPGSPDNLVGSAWSKRMSELMVGAGGPPPVYEPHYLEVGGVGQGSQRAHQKVKHTICMPTVDGPPVAGTYEAPEIESDRVPALLGLKSLSKMRAIMDMDPAHPRLIVPGPGGVQMQMAPGTVVYPLEPTHSGHLLLPCSDLDRRPGREFVTLLAGVHDDSAKTSEQNGSSGSTTTATTETQTSTLGLRSAATPTPGVCRGPSSQ